MREPAPIDPLTTQQGEIEMVTSIATCLCGHSLSEHASHGCTIGDCVCEEIRTEVLEAEIEAIDELG